MSGHFNRDRGFGVSDYYPCVNQFATIVRDPFQLAISNYFFRKRERLSTKGDFRDGERYDLTGEFNGVNDYLSRTRSYMLFHFPTTLTEHNYAQVLNDQFVYVGIAEDMDGSLRQMALHFHKKPIDSPIPKENLSIRDEKVDIDLKNDFRVRHPVEYAIYDWACKHYHG